MLQFHEFVQQFGREYAVGSEEFFKRQELFAENIKLIEEQNAAYAAGESTWSASINHFADMDALEMVKYRGYRQAPSDRQPMMGLSRPVIPGVDIPAEIDWRNINGKSFVSPVKNQASCGSCWAHAAVETIESHAAINLGIPVPELSPQQLVDCVQNPNQCGGTGGCEGATAEVAFNYSSVGITLNENYRYTGRDGTCRTSSPDIFVGSYVQLPANDAGALLNAVANVGPVSISVAAATWSFYQSGVFDGRGGKGCDVEVDHAVQLVGYGTDSTSGKGYWLVRNSWGPTWGESGYIRIQRNTGDEPCAVDSKPLDGVCGKSGECACPPTVTYCGTCAILSDSAYPTQLRKN